MHPDDETLSKEAIRLTLRLYWQQMKRNARFFIPALLLPGIGSIFAFYVPPLIVGRLVDAYQTDPHNIPILNNMLLFVGLWLVGELIFRVAMHLLNRNDGKGMEALYNIALQKLAEKDMGFFSDNFSGAITKRAVALAKNYESSCDRITMEIMPSFVTLIFVSVVLWRYSPWYLVFLYTSIALVIAVVVPLIKRRATMVAVRSVANTKIAGHIADVVGNMSAVKSFAREDKELKTQQLLASDWYKKALRSWDFHNLRDNIAISPIFVSINAAGLILATHIATTTGAGAGVILVSFAYLGKFTMIFWELNPLYRQLESLVTEAAEFGEYLLEPPTIRDPSDPKKLHIKHASITFKDVSFGYDTHNDASKPLFHDFSLDIRPGEKVGLVGPSGGGKTTISKLVLRFMDVLDGAVLIDGQNIASARQGDLRHYIAYVPQDPAMFHRSLIDNIRYERLDASDDEVVAAAKAAHVHEFIAGLPRGYETLVGERGTKLSGGQRQRIAIARAILKDAPILILDEATSALDSESELLIQDALRHLMQHKTAIVIAHRLSTIQKMDRIVVVDNGQITEQGTHRELLDSKGLYAKLWAHQSGGFIEE